MGRLAVVTYKWLPRHSWTHLESIMKGFSTVWVMYREACNIPCYDSRQVRLVNFLDRFILKKMPKAQSHIWVTNDVIPGICDAVPFEQISNLWFVNHSSVSMHRLSFLRRHLDQQTFLMINFTQRVGVGARTCVQEVVSSFSETISNYLLLGTDRSYIYGWLHPELATGK